jgi:hypothetical protein
LKGASYRLAQLDELKIGVGRLSGTVTALRGPAALIFRNCAPIGAPESQVLCGFPEIFAEFRRKHFELLWRGSRDGFRSTRIFTASVTATQTL